MQAFYTCFLKFCLALNSYILFFVVAYMVPLPIPFMMLTVGVGEVISAGVLGLILYGALNKYRGIIFKKAL